MKDRKGNELKAGDRVRITSLEYGYVPVEHQGLFVGNLGTVQGEDANGDVLVDTDGNTEEPGYGWRFEGEHLDKVKRSKWNTPGRYEITSYRSFRRYKAAGAKFVRRHSLDKTQDVQLTLAQALTKAKTLRSEWPHANPLYAIIE